MSDCLNLQQTLSSKLNTVSPFIDTIYKKIVGITGSTLEAFHVKLSLEEALTNAIRHGNKLDTNKRVAVSIQMSAGGITVDIHDEGQGFDVNGIADPTSARGRIATSGRGVFLMRSLMDDVVFYDGGAGVRMKKRFKTTR